MIVIPLGEVMRNAELEKNAISTLPESGCTPPSFWICINRLWFLPDFHVDKPVPADSAMMPIVTPSAVTPLTISSWNFFMISSCPGRLGHVDFLGFFDS